MFFMLIAFALTSLFNFYPGSYSVETNNSEVIINKGAQKDAAFYIKITEDNGLKVYLLEQEVNSIKTRWYVGILFTTSMFIGLANFLRLKSKIPFIITLLVFILAVILLSNSFIDSINYVESLIAGLK